MKLFYSAAKGGFYNSSIHGNNIPSGSVEISQEVYVGLLEGQGQGKIIVANAMGFPVLANQPEPSDVEKIARTNALIIQQILDLETKHQSRAIRDMVLREDNTALVKLDTQITELRSQLK